MDAIQEVLQIVQKMVSDDALACEEAFSDLIAADIIHPAAIPIMLEISINVRLKALMKLYKTPEEALSALRGEGYEL